VVGVRLAVAELALSRAGSLLQGIESGLGFGVIGLASSRAGSLPQVLCWASGFAAAGLGSSWASPAPTGIGEWLGSVACHVDEGGSSTIRRRALFDGERHEAKFRVEQQACGVFIEARQLHFLGLVFFEAQRGHGLDDVSRNTLATGVGRDDDVADAADAVVLSAVEVGEADELAVGQKSRGVEALADCAVHLLFR